MPGSPLRSPPPPASAAAAAAATPLQAQRTGAGAGGAWAVSPADKAKADRFFDGLDQEHKGVLEGQAAVPFFMQSGLGEATLAHIWDLSDVTQSGSLTRDEFAVAMHLINLKLTGSDLPQELPASLVPPGLRGTSLPQAVNPAETDTQRDLFSLIDDDEANNLPVSTASAFAMPASKAVASTSAPAAPAAASAFKSGPFDDDFLATSSSEPQAASSAVGTAGAGAGAMPTRSLDAGAELGNSRLALDSTQRSLATLETKRSELQKSVDDNDQNIGDIKARLESVKLRHQTETEAVKSLTERQAAQAAELSELRQTSVRDESELSRLRGEKDELEQALMRDREEVREMKKQASETQRQRDALAAEVEKLRKDARMQRGLVAIGKKQLSQAESDMEKTRQQLEEVKSGKFEHEPEAAAAAAAASDTTTTAPATAKEEAAGAGPVSREASISSPAHAHQAVASPAASVRSTNPFDRLGGGAGVAAGAGAGAAAVGAATVAGAAAIHHHAAAADEKEDEDPFGVSKQSSSQQTPAPPAAAAFDDNFGNDFQPQESNAFAAAPAPAQSNVNQAFDDAFADLDKGDEVAAKDEAGPVEVGQTDATPQADESHPTTTTTAFVDEPSSVSEPAHVAAPTADEVTSDADVTNVDKGKAAVRDVDEDSYEDSSDEDEGPEDVDGGAHTTASKAPTSDGADNEGAAAGAAAVGGGVAAGGLAASALPSATTTTQAADRFPEINDDDLEPATDATETLAPPSSHLDTSSAPGPVPLSAQATGDTDAAFHDASTGETPSTADFGTVGMGHAAQASSASALSPAHERFTTAVDDSTASPATKTRRAPPPAPSRGSTLSTTSAALSPLTTSVAPGPVPAPAPALATSTAPVAAPASTLDDFDAAFEDLGPATSTVGGTAPISASAAPGASANGGSTSFDDAFGNGDADDFDFVPKFQQPPSSAFGSHQAQGSSGNDAFDQAYGSSSAPQSGGFDGFDGAFAPPAASSQPPQPPPRQQPQQHPSATASQGSAFSFEDAFAPASTPPSLTMPGGASAAPVASNNASAATKATTPALADDAGPVKQLCGMGFSRESVIKALEKSNYRTEKALERLLAQTA
ncbi:hypothetical protein L7F22_007078 [Adiantum nelumboides]|nr:hypothetical protein [Adiantum nelumboides]